MPRIRLVSDGQCDYWTQADCCPFPYRWKAALSESATTRRGLGAGISNDRTFAVKLTARCIRGRFMGFLPPYSGRAFSIRDASHPTGSFA